MALHGAKPSRGAGLPQYASHAQQMSHAEQAIRTGGRVATQSVEDQMAVWRGMIDAASRPKHEHYFEKPDGTRVTDAEVEALKNGH